MVEAKDAEDCGSVEGSDCDLACKGIWHIQGTHAEYTLTLHKASAQKRFARSISGHQGTLVHFQDFTVCLIRFHPFKWPIVPI